MQVWHMRGAGNGFMVIDARNRGSTLLVTVRAEQDTIKALLLEGPAQILKIYEI